MSNTTVKKKRIAWNKGIKCPQIGRKCTEERREKIRLKAIERYKDPVYKEKHRRSIIGKPSSLKGKKSPHHSKTMKELWKQGVFDGPERGRKISLSKLGDRNPAWKGGISCEPYCSIWNDKGYKNDLKKRDNNICLNPECFGTFEFLCIHHIDYNKKNCHPSNLITICNRCNGKANKDRKWHESWYKLIMNKRYGYKY